MKQVSVETADVIRERDQLADKLRQIQTKEAHLPASEGTPAVESSLHASARNITLLRKLAEKQGEIHRLQVCISLCQQSANS